MTTVATEQRVGPGEGEWLRAQARPSRLGRACRLLRQHTLALAGLVLLLGVVLTALAAPAIAPADPLRQSIANRLKPPLSPDRQGRVALLGTDQLGRDILSRVVWGSRLSLLIAFSGVVISCLVGSCLGLLTGYYGGWFDSAVGALVNLQLAFPLMLLALAVVALMGANLQNIIVVFALTSWPIYMRTVRSSVLALKQFEFVQAARAVGQRDLRIVFGHVLPNIISPIMVIVSFEVARLIILEAALGFLGLGIQPPTPTWGNMLADGREYIRDAWWLATFPGLAIMLTAASVNFIGDGLRDVLDPRARFREGT